MRVGLPTLMFFVNKMTKQEKIYELFEPIVTQMGYECYDVELNKNGKNKVLIVYIDHPDGIKLDDCETVSRKISQFLDEVDPIQDAYTLEVSSPGIERKLTRVKHYQAAVGKKIDINLFKPINKKKKLCVLLKEAGDDGIVVLDDQQEIQFRYSDIAKATIHFDFN